MKEYGIHPARALYLVIVLCTQQLWAQEPDELFDAYGQLLARHAIEYELDSGGLASAFDYRAAIDDDTSLELIERQRRLLAELGTTPTDRREDALAFWINAYNFFMIAHIVDNPEDGEPVDSVKDFGGFFTPYRVFGRRIFDVAGQLRSLDDIEKDILLGQRYSERGWKDARVHFAVNCASVGCPPLRDRPYTPSNVERLLEDNTRRALRTPLHLAIEGETARLTRLFDWYQADFEESAGSVAAFIEARLDPSRRRAFRSTSSQRFMEYDWSLNSVENIRRWMSSEQPGR
jgi:hypothetical protein